IEYVQRAIAAGHEGPIADYRGARQDRAARNFELPDRLAVLRQTIKVLVPGANQDGVPGEIGARGNLRARFEGPALGAGLGINAMKQAVLVADVDRVAANARRRLERPALVLPLE